MLLRIKVTKTSASLVVQAQQTDKKVKTYLVLFLDNKCKYNIDLSSSSSLVSINSNNNSPAAVTVKRFHLKKRIF